MKREYYNNCEVDELKELEGAYVTGVEIMEDEENGILINIYFFGGGSFNDFRIVCQTFLCLTHEIHLVSYFVMCFLPVFGRYCFIYQV